MDIGSAKEGGLGVGFADPKPNLPLACNALLLKPVCSRWPKGPPWNTVLGARGTGLLDQCSSCPSSAEPCRALALLGSSQH